MNEISTYLNSHNMRDNQIKVNLQTFANLDETRAWQIFSTKLQLLTKLTEKFLYFSQGKIC